MTHMHLFLLAEIQRFNLSVPFSSSQRKYLSFVEACSTAGRALVTSPDLEAHVCAQKASCVLELMDPNPVICPLTFLLLLYVRYL